MKKLTNDEFIEKARKVHGDKYDYSESEYMGAKILIKIKCPEHGYFHQSPSNHLNGRNCIQCGIIKISDSMSETIEEFILKSNAIHGNKYDYSEVTLNGNHKKVKILCKIHGAFYQTPGSHKSGNGCKKCAFIRIGNSKRCDINEFKDKANEIHDSKYDYSNSEYKTALCKMIIECPKHGPFEQTPNKHIDCMQGCPKCGHDFSGVSLVELEIRNYISTLIDDVTYGDRSILGGKELDVVIHSKKIAVEVNGVYWHSLDKKPSGYHKLKRKKAESNGYRLISIGDIDWKNNRKKIERILKNAIGTNDSIRLNARDCSIVEINNNEYKEFANCNHIQGYAPAKYRFGLNHPEFGLVAVMTFREVKHGANTGWWDMTRYCTSKIIRGGQSKLFKHASKLLKMDKCQSFVDCDYFNGDSYVHSGFSLVADSTISFRVWHPKIGFMDRHSWWKSNIPKTLNKLGLSIDIFNENETQKIMMKNAGAIVIENSGTKRYEWIK